MTAWMQLNAVTAAASGQEQGQQDQHAHQHLLKPCSARGCTRSFVAHVVLSRQETLRCLTMLSAATWIKYPPDFALQADSRAFWERRWTSLHNKALPAAGHRVPSPSAAGSRENKKEQGMNDCLGSLHMSGHHVEL